MKTLRIAAVFMAALTGCKATDTTELEVLKKQITELKQVQRQVAIKVGLAELVRPEAIDLSSEGVWIGSESAPIVMIEYTDLHCPYCKKFQQDIWPEFKKQYVDTEQVAVLARDFPLVNIHPKAPYAAVMLQCANEQSYYSSMKEELFEIGSKLQEKDIDHLIAKYSLDEKQYKGCLADASIHNKVNRSTNEGIELGLNATPAFIVGRKQGNTIVDYEVITGAKPLADFSRVIERLSNTK